VNAIAILAGYVVSALLLMPTHDRGPGDRCAPGQLAVSRPLVLHVESAWFWRPLRDSLTVTPGDTVAWRHAVPDPPTSFPYLLRIWTRDAGGASCTTLVLKRSELDVAPPGPIELRAVD
jgi:hypothetical protein